MNIGEIIIYSILLFVIIYFSVRLAIMPLQSKQERLISENDDLGLVKLRDLEILSNTELEEIIRLYGDKGTRKEYNEQYEKYVRVINELKEMGYFSEEEYCIKIDKLKKHFKLD